MLAGLRRDAVVWIVRAAWLGLPFTAGPALADALDPTSPPVRLLCTIALWVGWSFGMVASCVPHPLALTTLRLLAPAGVAAAAGAALTGSTSALAVGWALVAAAWIFAPALGEWCVNGPAYPNERRYLLRTPGPLIGGLLGLFVIWALAIAGLCAGALLLAAKQWVPGTIVAAVGLPVAVLFLRALHGLSRRWLVFVPAGVVLHDAISLRDPVLFPRTTAEGLHLARAGAPDVLDLTQRSPGPAVELRLKEPVKLIVMKLGQRLGPTVEAAALAFTPTRPGAVLEEARRRRLPTGGR